MRAAASSHSTRIVSVLPALCGNKATADEEGRSIRRRKSNRDRILSEKIDHNLGFGLHSNPVYFAWGVVPTPYRSNCRSCKQRVSIEDIDAGYISVKADNRPQHHLSSQICCWGGRIAEAGLWRVRRVGTFNGFCLHRRSRSRRYRIFRRGRFIVSNGWMSFRKRWSDNVSCFCQRHRT